MLSRPESTMLLYFLLSILWAHNEPPVIFDFSVRDEQLCPASCRNQFKRTLFGITWSCLSTTFLCAWTAAHPNVPPRSRWKARWNRLKLMIWMTVVPEMVLVWAVRQYFAAKEIRDAYNQTRPELARWKKWTLTHGYTLEMGGFSLVDPEDENKGPSEQNRKVLTLDDLKQLLRDPKYEFPTITVADIQDRSKDDAFWIIITIFQTSWFVIQCIARGQQRLAPTQLELVTLALASMYAATFWVWWHKPLGLQEPVKIYQKTNMRDDPGYHFPDDQESQVSVHFRTPIDDLEGQVSVETVVRFSSHFIKRWFRNWVRNPLDYCALFYISTYIITFPVFVLFPLGIIFLLRITEFLVHPEPYAYGLAGRNGPFQIFYYRLFAVTNSARRWLQRVFVVGRENDDLDLFPFLNDWFFGFPLLFFFTIALSPLQFLVSFIFTAVFGIFMTSGIRPGASHVPFFYAFPTPSDHWSPVFVFTISGAVVGGLHLIGWNSIYPTHLERTIWRIASVAIIATSYFAQLIKYSNSFYYSYMYIFLDLVRATLLFIYISARLLLIAQAFALLRNLPPSALVAVDWTQYTPHIFS